MEYRLFTIVRYNYNYRDYNTFYVLLNINRLEFDKHMACFVTSKMVSLYTTTFLTCECELRRQHIYSSFTGLAPVLWFFSRAPSLVTGFCVPTLL